jgi:hypothetical protein
VITIACVVKNDTIDVGVIRTLGTSESVTKPLLNYKINKLL